MSIKEIKIKRENGITDTLFRLPNETQKDFKERITLTLKYTK